MKKIAGHMANYKPIIFALLITFIALLFVQWIVSPMDVSANSSTNSLEKDTPPIPTDIKFDHLTSEDGLDEDFVMDLIQTSDEYLWIATQVSIQRYDGYSFKIYTNDPEDNTSIQNGIIHHLLEDNNGNIWIATDYGLDMYDKNTDEFTHYTHDENEQNSLSGNRISEIIQDSNGIIWIGTRDAGLNSYSHENGVFTHYKYSDGDPNSISSDHVISLMEDNEGIIWVGTNGGGLNKFDPSTGLFTRFTNDPNSPTSIGSNIIESLIQDLDGNIWLGSRDQGLLLYDPDEEIFYNNKIFPEGSQKIENIYIRSLYLDSDGILWVGTSGDGLYVVNRGAGTIKHYLSDQNNPTSLTDDNIYSIYEDNSGIIWVTTTYGLNFYDRSKYKFTAHIPNPSDPNSLIGPQVWAIDNDEAGNLYIATAGFGLDYYDFKTGNYKHYLAVPNDEYSLSSNIMQTMIVDSEGKVWAGTVGDGISILDPTTEKFSTFNHDPGDINSISQDEIWIIYEDSNFDIWIGTFDNGLDKFDRATNSFTHFKHDPDNPETINSDAVTYVFEDSLGNLWVGTRSGLNILDRDTGQFTRFVEDENDPLTMGNTFVTGIIEDSETNLWIGTINGFYRFNRNEGTFENFNTSHGLPDNTVTVLLMDNFGDVWLGTFEGVSHFNPTDNSFRNYTLKDGLPSMAFGQGNFKAEDGQLFFGSHGGYISFYPEDIVDNSYIPPIVITDFLLFNESVPVGSDSVMPKALSELDEITLNYTDSIFSLEFSSLHFSDPESNQYAYMLEGVDDDWVYTSYDRRYVTYTNLDGGEYIFKVKGTNSDGVWNEEGRTLKITIIPPFWETTWFRVLMIILIAGAVVGGVQYRIRASELRRKELEVLVDEKTDELEKAQEEIVHQERLAVLGRLAGSVSHELRNPLGVISNSIYLLENAGSGLSKEEVKKYYGIISYESKISVKIITDLLDYGRDVDPVVESVNVKDLISNLLKKTPPPVDSEIEVKVEINPEDLSSLIDLEQIEIALKNLLDNAYQAMENGGVLSISANEKDGEVQIKISDTGVGISSEDADRIFQPLFSTKIRGFGLGLSVVKKYIEANNGRIEFASEVGEGTTFTIFLPVK